MKKKFISKLVLSLLFAILLQKVSWGQVIEAGTNQTNCNFTATLEATAPGTGFYGVWSVNAGFGAFVDNSNRNTVVNSVAFGNNIYRWTVYTDAGALQGTDDVTITNNLKEANAGTDMNICMDNTVLNAMNPSPGTGSWGTQSGSGTFTTPALYNTSVTDIGLGTNTYQWTVTHMTCNSSDNVVVTNNSVTADAGTSMTICTNSTVLAASNPSPGTGMWTILGGGGNFVNANMYNTPVDNIPLGNSTYRWTIENSGCTDDADITVTNDGILAHAGTDIEICTTSAILTGNDPSPGTGLWEVMSGSGIFTNNLLYNTPVTGVGLGTNTYKWTVSNNSCTNNDNVYVTNNSVTANAGTDQDICTNSTILDGNMPSGGTGTWSIETGTGSFSFPNQYNTQVTSIVPGNNVYKWRIENGTCFAEDFVTINNKTPFVDAGPDLEICSNTGTLMANIPQGGATGLWSDPFSAGVAFDDAANHNTSVTNFPQGTTTLRWTITNSPCFEDDDVTVTNNQITSIDAGTDQDICAFSSSLTASSLLGGQTGFWAVINGKGLLANPTANFTPVSLIGLGINEYKWTVQKGNCTQADIVRITNHSPEVYAGDDQAVYDVFATNLQGNMPPAGTTGVWSKISGGGMFGNTAEPTTPVTALLAGENVFRWTITPNSGLCNGIPYTDDVLVTVGVTQTISIPTTWVTIPPTITEFDKIIVEDVFNLEVPTAQFSEIYLGAGGLMTIGNDAKGVTNVTVKGLTIEPDPAKNSKGTASLRITTGGSLTIEPDPAKKGFTNFVGSGGSLTIEPDPARKGAQFTLTTGTSMTVASGGSLTIEPDPAKNSKDVNTVNIEEGAVFTLEKGAKLINLDASQRVSGIVNYELSFPYDTWNFFSSPVETSTVNVFEGAYMFSYLENTNSWRNLAWNDVLDPLKGVILKYKSAKPAVEKEVTFTGTPSGGTISNALNLTGSPLTNGYNLVGNPYSAPIYWNKTTGFDKTNTTGIMYSWNGVTYSTHNGAVGTPEVFLPMIETTQAFFVQSTNGGVFKVFPEAQIAPAKKELPKEPTDIIRFKVNNGELKDEIAVYFNENASTNYDLQIDANKFMESSDDAQNSIFYPQIYTLTPQGNKLTIDALNMETFDNVSVPIGININTSADLKLTAFGFEQFDPQVSLFLEDNQSQTIQDLRQNPTLTFKSSVGATENRFVLHFTKGTTQVENSEETLFNAFVYQKSIYVNLGNENNALLEVFDVAGKKVLSQKLQNSGQNIIATDLQQGNYIVKISNDKTLKSRKIFIK